MTVHLATCDDPFSLENLAARIRASSNFRFSWQFYQCYGIDYQSSSSIWQALEAIIATPKLHEFLRASFVPAYALSFDIKPVHEHCRVEPAGGEFEFYLALAADDRLGAYSIRASDVAKAEIRTIEELFESIGGYHPYELVPGKNAGCATCRIPCNHAFSSWYYRVCWDWCFFVVWPRQDLFWIGCLTDTD